MHFKSFLILFSVCLCTNIFAQTAVLFNKISSQNGLCNNKVNSFAQDKLGAIWIGTEDGLSRYNGHNFNNFYYDPNSNNTINHNAVYDILCSSNGYIYLGTFNGVCKINPYNFSIKRFSTPTSKDKKESLVVHQIKEAKNGTIFLATHRGLFSVKKDSLHEEFALRNNEILLSDIHSINIEEDNIWFCNQHKGLVQYNLKTNLYNLYPFPKYYQWQYGVQVKDIMQDQNDKNILWMATWGRGLLRYNKTNKTFEQYLINKDNSTFGNANIFLNLSQTNYNEEKKLIWINSLSESLCSFNTDTKQFISYKAKSKIEENKIYAAGLGLQFLKDQLWIGTNEGIYTYNNKHKNIQKIKIPFKNKATETIYNIQKTSQEYSLTIKSSNTKHYFLNTNTGVFENNKTTTPYHDYNIVYSYQDRDNNFWFEDYTKGLHKISNNKIYKLKINANTIIEQNDYIIVGSNDGIYKIKKLDTIVQPLLIKGGHWKIREDISMNISGLVLDKNNKIWFSTLGGINTLACIGCIANEYLQNIFYNTNTPYSLKEKQVIGSLICDTRNNIYATTWNGILYWNANNNNNIHFKYFNKTNGLCNNKIYTVAITKNNYLFANTLSGLFCWNLNNNEIKNYNSNNGISFDEAETMTLTKDETKLVLGFKDEINIIPVNEIFVNSSSDSVFIDKITIHNKNSSNQYFTETKNIKFKASENNISIELSTFNFTENNNTKYEYKLTGNNWIDVNENTIQFNNLSAGNYTLQVRCISYSGNKSDKITQLKFSVAQYWYKSWWFLLICICLVLFTIYKFYKNKIEKLKTITKLRNKIAKDLHDDIGSTLTSINIMSNVSKINLKKDLRKSEDLLNKIQNYSEEIQQNMSDIVWAVNPENDKSVDLIARIKEYANYTLEQEGINVLYNIEPSILNLKIEMNVRKEILLLCKEIINNAAKYSKATQVKIEFAAQDNSIKICISDNGIGFNKHTTKKGNGLVNIEQRAINVNAKIKSDSQMQNGTSYTILIPLKHKNV